MSLHHCYMNFMFLHHYYMDFTWFTCNNDVFTSLLHGFYMFYMTITCYFFTANLVNVHEKTCSRPSTWMVVAFLPVSGAESMWDVRGGTSKSVRSTELVMECNDCLFEGWNEQTAQIFHTLKDGLTNLK